MWETHIEVVASQWNQHQKKKTETKIEKNSLVVPLFGFSWEQNRKSVQQGFSIEEENGKKEYKTTTKPQQFSIAQVIGKVRKPPDQNPGKKTSQGNAEKDGKGRFFCFVCGFHVSSRREYFTYYSPGENEENWYFYEFINFIGTCRFL